MQGGDRLLKRFFLKSKTYRRGGGMSIKAMEIVKPPIACHYGLYRMF